MVYLPQEGRGIGLVAKLKAYRLQDEGLEYCRGGTTAWALKRTCARLHGGAADPERSGTDQVPLLTNNPKKTEAFENWVDLKVVGQVPIIAPNDPHREVYMRTKREKMGHLLPE